MNSPISSRERLMITMSGRIADRVPVAPFVQDEYLAFYYPQKASVDRVIDARELADELDFDLVAKPRIFEIPHFLKKSYPNWELRKSQESSGGYIREKIEITTPGGTLVQEEIGPDVGAASAGIHKAFSRHFLQTDEDTELFFRYLPPLDRETIEESRSVVAEWRRVMGERGVLAPWGWAGVFNAACNLRGVENLVMDPYENPEAYHSFMSRLSDAMCAHTAMLAETDLECIGVQGNMANASVMSADFFREFVQPYEQRTLDTIHAAGKASVYHNCGKARAFYENYSEMRMTVWETVSAPPQGDNDLADAKAALHGRVCLLGNLDHVYFLKTASPSEVAERTKEIVRTGKPGGGYIFSTSDYLEKNTPRANVVAMVEAAKEEGIYS